MRAQELSAEAYLEWYEAHVAETLAVRDKIWGREQYGNPLYYYHDGLAIYNRQQHELHTIPSRPQQKVPEHACYAYLRPKQLQY
jgi:hypothetical protein